MTMLVGNWRLMPCVTLVSCERNSSYATVTYKTNNTVELPTDNSIKSATGTKNIIVEALEPGCTSLSFRTRLSHPTLPPCASLLQGQTQARVTHAQANPPAHFYSAFALKRKYLLQFNWAQSISQKRKYKCDPPSIDRSLIRTSGKSHSQRRLG